MKLARQAGGKGIAAASGFTCARLMDSSLQSIYEYIEAQREHYCGANNRPTIRKSASRVSSYLVPFGGMGFLYPDFVGQIVLGLGLGITSVQSGVDINTHTGTIANRSTTNEMVRLTITGNPGGGTFTVTFGGQTTTPALAYNVAAADMQTALRALSSIGGANVTVTGSAGGPYTLEFIGTLAATDVGPVTADGAGLTGGVTPDVTVTLLATGAVGAPYMTALHSYGDGGERYELRATDARVEQWSLEAGPRGIQQTFAGTGIKEDPADGTETSVNETDAMLLPSKGAATITVMGESFTSPIRGLRFVVSNPVDKREQELFALTRSDLPQTGMEVGGEFQGIDMTFANYKLLKWAADTATGPTEKAITGDVSFKFESAEMLEATTPYSAEVIIPNCEFRLGNFRARGIDLVRAPLAFLMLDAAATPLTVKFVNGVAGY
jgi:hypothetical protein